MTRRTARAGLAGGTTILLAVLAFTVHPSAVAAPPPERDIHQVAAAVETDPVAHGRDAADDPAIWVHPTEPAKSLIIGNDKQGALETYGLDGRLRQRVATVSDFWGNIDVRQGVRLDGRTVDVVAAMNGRLRLFTVDAGTQRLTEAGRSHTADGAKGQGLCLYDSPRSGLSAFVVDNRGHVRQFTVSGIDDGDLRLRLVRTLDVVRGTPPPEATEACVADDATGDLYVAEENVGLWRYSAEPDASRSARSLVDSVADGGHLVADVEGLALTYGASDYLIASAQSVRQPRKSYFAVYQRTGGNRFIDAFRVVGGRASDGCERTDGIAAYDAYLGPDFPRGLFVCQDNTNRSPGPGHQNFKLVRLDQVLG